MAGFVDSVLLESNTNKRYIAAMLAVLIEVLKVIPGCAHFVAILEPIAALFGGVGVGHAALSGTLTQAQLAGVSSALSTLLFLVYFIPPLAPFVGVIQTLAFVFGAGAMGSKFAEVTR